MTQPHTSASITQDRILILDFGSQYSQLIARRVREAGVYCEMYAYDMDEQAIREFAPKGIILSGGPESVYEAGSPRAPKLVFELGVPVLGICYGMQTMAAQLGGQVEAGTIKEFCYPEIQKSPSDPLFDRIEDTEGKPKVWMRQCQHPELSGRRHERFESALFWPAIPPRSHAYPARRSPVEPFRPWHLRLRQ